MIRVSLLRLATVVAVGLAASAAGAQQNVQNNALQGFAQNRDQPVKIDANTLEVRDKDKVATFSGNVHLVQGDTTLRCQTLVVFYEQDSSKPDTGKAAAPAMKSATPVAPGGGNQSIKRLEARGDVVVLQKDQKATGDTGIFDMKSNTVTLHSSRNSPVVIAQGQNVVRGDRLVVNLTTGVSRVECNNPRDCRVSALIAPKAGPPGAEGVPGMPGAGNPSGAPGASPAAPHGRGGQKPGGPSGVY
jgi:lipopolysaccharide export system protein LptA